MEGSPLNSLALDVGTGKGNPVKAIGLGKKGDTASQGEKERRERERQKTGD